MFSSSVISKLGNMGKYNMKYIKRFNESVTEEELENWQMVQYRMDNEGIDYCFEHYSSFEEIKDEEFHKLRLEFLESMKKNT